jgi:hypothetical protein
MRVVFWNPQVVFVGFFSSEQPFCAAASLYALFFRNAHKSKGSALLAGVAAAGATHFLCIRSRSSPACCP